MRFFRKIFALFFVVFFLALPCSVYAEEQFKTGYDISYNVDSTGVTTVRQVVKLTNKLEQIYATQYNIVIGSTDLFDVSAQDDFGELKPRINNLGNSVNIVLVFDKKLVGKDKTRTIILLYKTKDFATVRGRVLDVGLPILANTASLENYNLQVNIPSQFGKVSQISTQAYEFVDNGKILTYVFDGLELDSKKGITATFGKEQLLDFVLRYTLENTYDTKAKTEIALPPDTGHQKVIYSKIEPEPDNVEVDFDGNWLASYVLEPQQTTIIKAHGSVLISSDYNEEFNKELSEVELENLTKPDNYWESTDTGVKNLAQSLGTPEAIYDYLVENYTYDYERLSEELERMGAKKAIANPSEAVCMEFTDTFVAMARSLGIPAREHNGFAFAENDKLRPISKDQDMLHSWPEYYDKQKKQWIEIDPTWGNTTGGLDYFNKFDLDHFTSVIHGLESEYPVTVASYKTKETVGKDIEVSFGENFEPKQDLAFEIVAMKKGKTGMGYRAKVLVFNTGTAAIYNVPVSFDLTNGSKNLVEADETIKVLPPYGQVEISLDYLSSWKDKGGKYRLAANGFGKNLEQEVVLERIVSPVMLYVILGLMVMTLALVVVIKAMRNKK